MTPADLEMVISTINHNMHFLWLEVRRVVDDQTGVCWYGIANTRADDVAKLATSYTEREVEFLKKLVRSNPQESVPVLNDCADATSPLVVLWRHPHRSKRL